MPKVFEKSLREVAEEIEKITLSRENGIHVAKSLRMRRGDSLIVSDGEGRDFCCEIEQTSPEVVLKVLFVAPTDTEPEVYITLYQGVPKGDKFAQVVKQCTEIGVSEFVPVIMARSISRPDEKTAAKKVERWRKIAHEAAGQSRRGIIPKVADMMSLEDSVKKLSGDRAIVFYESGGEGLKDILNDFKRENVHSADIFIGPEGGFEPSEVEALKNAGARVATLGRRILRTQTAPLAASANIIYELSSP